MGESHPADEAPLRVHHPIDFERSRFPYAIVWSPLPPITWLLPFIGHMGIADSRGVIYDFAGPYHIGEDCMAFGAPTRYVQLDPALCKAEEWDRALLQGCEVYSKRLHNICCDNCHSHVAHCLNVGRYDGRSRWNMVMLAAWVFFRGKHIGVSGVLRTWLPFFIALLLWYSFSPGSSSAST